MNAITRKHTAAAAARPVLSASQACAFIMCGFCLAAAAVVTHLPRVTPLATVEAHEAYRTEIGLQPATDNVDLAANLPLE